MNQSMKEVNIVSVVQSNAAVVEDKEVSKVAADKSSKAELESALERIQEVEEELWKLRII